METFDPTEPTEVNKEEARQEIRNTVHDGRVERRSWQGRLLVTASILVGLLFLVTLAYRSYTTETTDRALCEKLDRFVVTIEKRTLANPDTTEAQKQAAIKLYENFRNDPPTCRTTP